MFVQNIPAYSDT